MDRTYIRGDIIPLHAITARDCLYQHPFAIGQSNGDTIKFEFTDEFGFLTKQLVYPYFKIPDLLFRIGVAE